MAKELIFTKGFVYRPTVIYIRAVLPKLEMFERNHAFMFRWMDGRWGQWAVNRRIVAHGAYDVSSERVVILVSNDGYAEISDSQGSRWERIDETDNSPNNLRSLKCLTKIDEFYYVAGMSRMVYRRRIDLAKWERIDKGVRVPRSDSEIAGFAAISGTDSNNLYCAGLTGQVWHYNGKQWHRLDVGTNLGLNDIEIVSSELMYLCGNAGIVLKGFGDRWQVITNDVTEYDFYSIARIKNRIFLSTSQNEIYEIKNDEVIPVNIGLDYEVTTYSLHSNHNTMVSVGSDHILIFDGSNWRDIGRPDSD